VSYQELLVKFLDGLRHPPTRADAIATFSLLQEAYRAGRLDDGRLMQALKELCLDVLMEMRPGKDVDELEPEAEDWASKFHRAIRTRARRERLTAELLPPA